MKEMQTLKNIECLSQVIDFFPNGMIIVDHAGQMVLANSQAEVIFGYDREEILGQPLAILISKSYHGSHPLGRSQYFESPVAEPIGVGRELRGSRKDGSDVTVEIGLMPLTTSEGLFIIGEIVEITSRKQLEGKVRRINDIDIQESERRQLARKLHNELGQLLSAISLNLQEVRKICGSSAEQLDPIIRRNNEAIEQVQDFSNDLRPVMLDDLGLAATLRWYADRQLQRANVALNFVAQSAGIRPAHNLATACFRVLQEALSNVIRHAHARQVSIELHETLKEVWLSIRDDGNGFDSTSLPNTGAVKSDGGMLRMTERVEILSGTIEIQSAPHQGTSIQVWIPLTPATSLEPM